MRMSLSQLRTKKISLKTTLKKIKFYYDGGTSELRHKGEHHILMMREQDRKRAEKSMKEIKEEIEMIDHLIDMTLDAA